MDVLKTIFKPLKAMIAFSAIINILMLAVPIYSLQLFTRVLTNYSFETLFALTIITVFLLAIQALLDYLRQQGLLKMGLNLNAALSGQALENTILLANQPVSQLDTASPQLKFREDIQQVSRTLSHGNVYNLFDMPFTPLFIAALFIIHPYIGLMVVGVSAILIGLSFVLSHLHDNFEQSSHHQLYQQYLPSADAIASMGMASGVKKHWDTVNHDALFKDFDFQTRIGKVLTSSKSVRLLLQVMVMGAAVYLAMQGLVVPGAVIAASIIVSRALAPIEQSVTQWHQWLAAWQAYKRIKEVMLAQPPENLSPVIAEGDLIMEQLYYAPESPSKPVLSNISLTLEQGKAYFLTGGNGAGKSTLMRMFLGLFKPTSGHVLLNGMEVYDWLQRGLSRTFGYLPQDLQLVKGSILDNLSHFRDIDDDHLYEICKLCGIHELIMALPQAYQTQVSSSQSPLSRGQLQLLCLARAIVNKPYLVVLDEPDSALDQAGHKLLMTVLNYLKTQGTTVLMVSHSQQWLSYFDHVIVIEGGRIAKTGKVEVKDSSSQSLASVSSGTALPNKSQKSRREVRKEHREQQQKQLGASSVNAVKLGSYSLSTSKNQSNKTGGESE